MINDTKKSETSNARMLNDFGFSGGSIMVENEIIELQSANLMRDVVKELGLYVSCYKKGNLRYADCYKNSPITLNIDNPEISDVILPSIWNLAITVTSSSPTRINRTVYEGSLPRVLNFGDYIVSFDLNREIRDEDFKDRNSNYRQSSENLYE